MEKESKAMERETRSRRDIGVECKEETREERNRNRMRGKWWTGKSKDKERAKWTTERYQRKEMCEKRSRIETETK